MNLCIFNPEHDLCLSKGRAFYIPPRSAVEFAIRDANIMNILYPDAQCYSVYSLPSKGTLSPTRVTVWGWNKVVKHELLKYGISNTSLLADDIIDRIRELQHRTTVLPLQPDCRAVSSIEEVEQLLRQQPNLVLKAPWSGAGRGLRWVHGKLSDIDRSWIVKISAQQRCVMVEPIRSVVADLALEYTDGQFIGYSYFSTGSGVYKGNQMMTDEQILYHFRYTQLLENQTEIDRWLQKNIWPLYQGPLGVDLMVCEEGRVYVSEINFRHTMGMVAHQKILNLQ